MVMGLIPSSSCYSLNSLQRACLTLVPFGAGARIFGTDLATGTRGAPRDTLQESHQRMGTWLVRLVSIMLPKVPIDCEMMMMMMMMMM